MRIRPLKRLMAWTALATVVFVPSAAWSLRNYWPAAGPHPSAPRAHTETSAAHRDGHDEHSCHQNGHCGDDHHDPSRSSQAGHHHDHDHGHNHGHGHGHRDDHDSMTVLTLSAQARRNLGLSDEKIRTIELQTFTRTIPVPAVVAERPGRSHIQIAAPMTGIVTGVQVMEGEAVQSGRLLFKLRLTHEDLVKAQTDFLRTLGALDVENREIARLEEITSGVVAGKVLLDRQYEKMKLEAALKADREALLLHGLTQAQIDEIAERRRLLREMEIFVPLLHTDASLHDDAEEPDRHQHPLAGTVSIAHNGNESSTGTGRATSSPGYEAEPLSQRFIVQKLHVQRGQSVQAGESLCLLADLSELQIEGRAFEQDADELTRAANEGWEVQAILEDNVPTPQTIGGLKILYISSEVARESRALNFYVGLPNQVVRDVRTADGHHFIGWKFRPGQRMQLLIPVEQWEKRIVLPVDAVAREGAECFVFVQDDDHFDRRPVHVEYRDRHSVVIANDGSLSPGERVALTGAHQMQMALKNQAGGAVDPHAGHNH